MQENIEKLKTRQAEIAATLRSEDSLLIYLPMNLATSKARLAKAQQELGELRKAVYSAQVDKIDVSLDESRKYAFESPEDIKSLDFEKYLNMNHKTLSYIMQFDELKLKETKQRLDYLQKDTALLDEEYKAVSAEIDALKPLAPKDSPKRNVKPAVVAANDKPQAMTNLQDQANSDDEERALAREGKRKAAHK